MQRFEDVVAQAARGSISEEEVRRTLDALGGRAAVPLGELGTSERAQLADRFVRNLKSLSMQQATELQRELVRALEAPPGRFTSRLDGAVSLVELRSHLKHALAGLGLDWDRLTRAQSLVAGVARWLQSIGGAHMDVTPSEDAVDFVLTAEAEQLTPDEIRRSPLVQMLSAQTARFNVEKQQTTVEITFSIQRAA